MRIHLQRTEEAFGGARGERRTRESVREREREGGTKAISPWNE